MNRGPWMGLDHAETSIHCTDILVIGVPILGGMTTRRLYDTLQELTRRASDASTARLPRLHGFDLVEISPPADVNNITAFAGMGILINTFGLVAVQRGLNRDVPQ